MTPVLLARLTDSVPLKVVCGWCQSLMRDGALPVSHGMCPACIVRMEAEAA